ncbi:MAG: universal stress protein [Phaeodactylibacter sp.]|nr:universal stress protein [Phaeodactylibacter sp.]
MSLSAITPKHLLVPVDYSSAARSGFDYAEAFRQYFPAQLTALFVQDPGDAKHPLEEEQRQLQRFVRHYPEKEAENYGYEVVRTAVQKGPVIPAILQYLESTPADLLILGMRSKHEWWEYLLGSTSSHLLHRAPIPVLLVPEGTTFQPLRKLVLLSDLDMEDEPAIAQLLALGAVFDAQVEQLFINPLPSDFNREQEIVYSTDWTGNALENCTKVTMVRNRSIQKGVDYFIEQHQPQLLAVRQPAAQRWIGFQQRLRHLAYSISIPLLILR